jgi:1-acyl-sn-glycerol-3-phosphate acyltransferase
VTAPLSQREPRKQSWLRRLQTIPLLLLLALLAWATLPLWLVAVALLDGVRPQLAIGSRARMCIILLVYLTGEVLGLIVAGLIWLFTLGGVLGGTHRYIAAHAALQRIWTGTLFALGRRLLSLTVRVQGAEQAAQGPFFLLVRHSSAADTLIAAAVIANPHKILLRYVLKRELLVDPCLDVVGQRLPNAFVKRGSQGSAGDVAAVASLARDLNAHAAVLIYPEGTRFSPPKRLAAIQALRDKGRADLAERAQAMPAVMPPKPAGVLALLQAAPGTDVVFLDHAGLELSGGLRGLWRGELVGRTLHIRLRRVAAAAIPQQDRELWLYDAWRECDAYARANAHTTG